jgi:4a-hydroxytetrahydrobiopterin dehydratase
MNKLQEMKCVPCRSDAHRITEAEIQLLTPQIPEWTLRKIDHMDRLERTYTFRDFSDALVFTNKIGVLADKEDHHPALLTEWGKVTVTWWTHKIKGLHRNDFIMAAKTDRLY